MKKVHLKNPVRNSYDNRDILKNGLAELGLYGCCASAEKLHLPKRLGTNGLRFRKFGVLKLKKMAKIITIDYPEYLANSMRMNKDDFGKQIKESALVKLFEIGKVSSGTAARVLEMSRVEFLELLNKYKVSYLNTDDLEGDLANA